MEKKRFIERYKENVVRKYSRRFEDVNDREKYNALCDTLMEEINQKWILSREKSRLERKAYYFSAEFLMGRALGCNLLNLGLYDEVKEALSEIKIDIEDLETREEDAALGNGGLGRLAACFMDSAATMNDNLCGYGIRYSQGIFKQKIENGFQVEEGDDWLKNGDGWSIRVESDAKIISFRDQKVKAVPYDMPVIGYKNGKINTLRLWQAEAFNDFDFTKFNNFQYDGAVSEKNRAEDITRVLYPNDDQRPGKVLRLKQQYFFSSASIQDMVERYKKDFPEDITFKDFSKYNTIQLNDTHPVIAIPELIRILLDEQDLSWDEAFRICTETFNFTNHTVLQEALEKWTVDIVTEVNPRIKDIIFEINRRLIEKFKQKGISDYEIEKYKIVHDDVVEMAYLAVYVSRKVNGVAKIHSNILINDTLSQWYKIMPEKFSNKTNGVTPRRRLMYANPKLSNFITKRLGNEEWKYNLSKLKELEKFVDDEETLKELMDIKKYNKERLARYLKTNESISVNTNSIFDILVKRIHEYKRQHLCILHCLYLYFRLKEDKDFDIYPTTYIIGGKAAPGYYRAKGIIKFANEVSRLINGDSEVSKKLKLVFISNYRVTYGEKLFPAADISEQISTAGKEASGTGNMKFMMNAAPTIGTYDGANIEIFEASGEENNFRFGNTVEELEKLRESYDPYEIYNSDKYLKRALDALIDGTLSDDGSGMLSDLYSELTMNGRDTYFVLADFNAYRKAHEEVSKTYKDKNKWAKMALMNLANCGKFSSDRTIKEYADEIWYI
ncbi:MAG: glycogen/starch/alpha-glucan phosphorylase [Peptoniphilaceae bacterium]|nr:glycogen/starch/alpha-glucan phosphorylase [Peptoniphilaceae bacterium]MDD7383870.1 glycogen/starch/alpha-glucan phosphorylase [Peptoniphilaceae bacterium]MDY3738011.1 glycogen/starch/alpha-glucan phosphorylase [Peptoniphilaceae bacterium]